MNFLVGVVDLEKFGKKIVCGNWPHKIIWCFFKVLKPPPPNCFKILLKQLDQNLEKIGLEFSVGGMQLQHPSRTIPALPK